MRRLAYYLTIAFVLSVPWEAAIHLGPLGQGSKVLGIVAGVTWLLSAIARGRVRAPDAFHKASFLFVVWGGLTFFWSIVPSATWRGFLTYTLLFLMIMMLWDLLDTRKKIETAVQAYVLGAFITSGSIIAKYLSSPAALFPAHDRINALGYQTDGIALIVAIAGPAAWYLAVGPTWSQRSLAWRVLNFAYLPFGLMALVLTGTRGATIASLPTALLILWSLKHASGTLRALALGACVCASVLVFVYAPKGMLDRIATASSATQLGQQGGALSGRWSIWTASLSVWSNHPVQGVGVDAHRTAVAPILGQQRIYKKQDKEAHNAYISVLTETGLVGELLFLGVLGCVFVRIRELSGWQRWYWSVQVGVILIDAMSLSIENGKSIWIFLSLAVGAAAAARVETASEVVPSDPRPGPRLPLRKRLEPVRQ